MPSRLNQQHRHPWADGSPRPCSRVRAVRHRACGHRHRADGSRRPSPPVCAARHRACRHASSITERAIASPMPVPPARVVKKTSKILSRSSGGMPGPLSSTRMITPRSPPGFSRDPPRACTAPAGCGAARAEWLKASMAFWNRFSRACCICSWLTSTGLGCPSTASSTRTSFARALPATMARVLFSSAPMSVRDFFCGFSRPKMLRVLSMMSLALLLEAIMSSSTEAISSGGTGVSPPPGTVHSCSHGH